MPKRVKKAHRRREIAAQVMATAGESAVCAERRFPRNPTVRTKGEPHRLQALQDKDKPREYADIAEIRKETGMSLTSEHFRMMENSKEIRKELYRVCTSVVGTLSGAIVDRAEEYDDGTVYSAFTDSWLCVRAARLCKP